MNRNLLKAEIVKAGMTQEELSKRIGMAPSTLYRKMRDDKFGIDEAKKIVSVLGIKDPATIFFS